MGARALSYLAGKVRSGFPGEVAHRRIGREAEFPLVGNGGGPGDAQLVLEDLIRGTSYEAMRSSDGCVGARGPRFAFMTEVGRATIEIVFDPVDDLFRMAELYESAVRTLTDSTHRLHMSVQFRGVHPTAVASDELMTMKARYRALHDCMGKSWLWFTVTAGDQTHLDVSQDEAASVFAVTNRLTPVVHALCGNSAAPSARSANTIPNAREWRMGELLREDGFPGRHGQLPEGIDSLESYVSYFSRQRFLMLDERRSHELFSGSFEEWAVMSEPDDDELWAQYEFHEHYVWPSARLRTRTGTIELRGACQQPRNEHASAAALHLGLVEGWRDLRDVHPAQGMDFRALTRGLDLPEGDRTVVHQVLEVCEAALRRRDCGEEAFLRPLWRRLHNRMNPGQEQIAGARSEVDG
jgi:hypothetical protein